MKRHALFVGVDQYADASFRNLRYSVSDAAALAGMFGRHGYDTHVLTNPKTDEVLEEVERRSAGLGPGDVFLFFFAGHGFTAQGGEHLLICANDRLPYLRCNRAGIPVDLLEELTNGRGFHRAFLLDACRTDVFSGVESRGAETRDLGLVTLPDARENPGTCSVLRSCDKFCPALEFDDLGHGIFTQAVLGVVEDDALRTLPFGEPFVASVRDRMRVILQNHAAPADQTPAFQTNGAPFPLFELTTDNREGPATLDQQLNPVLVKCPICKRWRSKTDTFDCSECGRENLCIDHQDRTTYLCVDCAARKAREEAIRQEAARKAEEEREAWKWIGSQAGERKIVHVGLVEVALRWCPPGTFTMGAPALEEGHFDDETQHRVTLTKGFWMGETQVTQSLWNKVMGLNPSDHNSGSNYPVESVSWNDCQVFLQKLNALALLDGFKWALPTEAQWEYACRAGTIGAYGGNGCLDEMGWYQENSGNETHPVGQKRANAWGLHDMHGNVVEWCQDWYGAYPDGQQTDPLGPALGHDRVLRGGGYWDNPQYCRSACRVRLDPSYRRWSFGFRLVTFQIGK